MIAPTYDALKRVIEEKGYVWFSGSKPFDLNIVGIRNLNAVNAFDDTICVAYLDIEKRKRIIHFPATTDPGLFYLKNPMNASGTAILKEGQYRGAYRLGKHKGYTALVQIKPVSVYRDVNKDGKYDFNGKIDTGLFGIDIHRALEFDIAKTVDKFSAGCQVIQSPDDFAYLIALVKRQKQFLGTDIVTYTLILENSFAINSNS